MALFFALLLAQSGNWLFSSDRNKEPGLDEQQSSSEAMRLAPLLDQVVELVKSIPSPHQLNPVPRGKQRRGAVPLLYSPDQLKCRQPPESLLLSGCEH